MEGTSWHRHGRGGAALLVVLAVFEIVLVGKLDAQETPAGIAIAAVATVLTVAALAAAGLRYRVRWSWAWLAALVIRNVVRDTFVVCGTVLRCMVGGHVDDAFQDVPFDAGAEDDPADAARRALVVAAVSTSPNAIVLSLDPRQGTMRVHVLASTGGAQHSAAWPL